MSIFYFLKNVRRELFENTTWPSKDVVLQYTVWVVVSLFFAALFLFGVDYFSGSVVNYLFVERVTFFRTWLDWMLEFRYGVPFRFLLLVFSISSTFYLFGRVFANDSL